MHMLFHVYTSRSAYTVGMCRGAVQSAAPQSQSHCKEDALASSITSSDVPVPALQEEALEGDVICSQPRVCPTFA